MAFDDFDWNLIKSFLAVAEGGSLSAAARSLASSQPTVGRHIGELEQSLGVTLFERTAQGMALTDSGSQLLGHARRIAGETASFSLAATGRSTEIAGTIRVTASEVVSHFLLPPIIARLREAEPQLQIEMVSSNAVQNLLTRDADIAVRMIEPAQTELIARKVNEIAVGAFAAPSYLEKRGIPEKPEDLLSHSIVGYDRNDLLIREFAKMGQALSRHAFDLRTDDQVLNWRLVEAGAGVGFGQLYVARKSRKVVRILPDLGISNLPMWVAAHRELRTSLRVRRAYDFIAGALADLPLAS